MRRSVFCIGTPGAGYGTRAVLAVLMGCIPVLLGDDVEQAFAEQVDWSQFSVRVAEADVSRIVDTVAAVPPAAVAAMQAALACAWRFFTWTSLWGALADEDGSSDAFEVLMWTLRQRKLRAPGVAPPPKLRACDAVPDGFAAAAQPLCRAGECARGLAEHWPHGGAAAAGLWPGAG